MNEIKTSLKLPGVKVTKVERNKFDDLLITVETTEEHVNCRICKKKIYKRHGTDRIRKLKHLPSFGDDVYIIYRPNRYVCENCKDKPTTTATPSWHSANSSHTTAYENHLLMELVNSTIVDVAIKEKETEESIVGVVTRRIEGEVVWKNIKHLGIIGIDEIALKRGHKDYVTIITGRVERKTRLLATLPGHKKATIVRFLKSIPKRLIKTIEVVCVDMYTGYIHAVKKVFKNKVPIVIDRFHVAKLYRKELDRFRQKTLKQLKQELTEKQYQQIVGATKILRRKHEVLTSDEKEIIETLFSYSPKLMEAYSLAIKLTQIFNTYLTKEDAVAKLNDWVELVRKKQLECFNKFIKSLNRWKNEIANYFIDRNTSAFVEGLNNKIKVLKRRCYGIYNLKHFFQRLFLDMSGYELYAANIRC